MTAATDTAQRIVSAAAELFAERGYQGTTTKAIAEKAGVNEVTLFRHFDNKAGILKGLAQRFAEQSAAQGVTDMPHPDDARATLLTLARREIAASVENGGVALRLAFDAKSVPEVADLIGEGPAHNLRALADYIADRQAGGQVRDDIDAVILAEAFSSLTSSYVMYRMVMGVLGEPVDVTADETVEQLFDVFWSGAGREGQE